MHESSDPIKPSTPQNSIIQIGLIALAAFVLYIWNSQRKPPPTITIPENTAASASEKAVYRSCQRKNGQRLLIGLIQRELGKVWTL